jgi:hypothetical protein
VAVVSAAARDLAMVVGRVQISSATPSPSGGTGRRAGLRSPCPQGREGPNPSWGTLEGWPRVVRHPVANRRSGRESRGRSIRSLSAHKECPDGTRGTVGSGVGRDERSGSSNLSLSALERLADR